MVALGIFPWGSIHRPRTGRSVHGKGTYKEKTVARFDNRTHVEGYHDVGVSIGGKAPTDQGISRGHTVGHL